MVNEISNEMLKRAPENSDYDENGKFEKTFDQRLGGNSKEMSKRVLEKWRF